mmetsp:Transcript_16200/g.41013  ORF Transcript_16200/g.41013 Transcript_16200/m.41013 type:complete len:321 (+) Transcript_16200:2921-3883(+)
MAETIVIADEMDLLKEGTIRTLSSLKFISLAHFAVLMTATPPAQFFQSVIGKRGSESNVRMSNRAKVGMTVVTLLLRLIQEGIVEKNAMCAVALGYVQGRDKNEIPLKFSYERVVLTPSEEEEYDGASSKTDFAPLMNVCMEACYRRIIDDAQQLLPRRAMILTRTKKEKQKVIAHVGAKHCYTCADALALQKKVKPPVFVLTYREARGTNAGADTEFVLMAVPDVSTDLMIQGIGRALRKADIQDKTPVECRQYVASIETGAELEPQREGEYQNEAQKKTVQEVTCWRGSCNGGEWTILVGHIFDRNADYLNMHAGFVQ